MILQDSRIFFTLKRISHTHTTNSTIMKNLLTLAMLTLSLTTFGQGQVQKEVSGSIAFVSGKVMQLAQAVPAEKYAWAPQIGVRSFAGVFAHIVSANYFFASKLGAKIPDGVNMETIEKDLKTKEQVSAALKQSYELIVNAVKNT